MNKIWLKSLLAATVFALPTHVAADSADRLKDLKTLPLGHKIDETGGHGATVPTGMGNSTGSATGSGSTGSGVIACCETGATGMATRIFAGPTEYPPVEYAAYGIVAFRSVPSQSDMARYKNICVAYLTTLPPPPVNRPKKAQMVTVWPVMTADVSKRLNKAQPIAKGNEKSAEKACEDALSSYNLQLGHLAIKAARIQGEDVDGIGPYLLAWSPSEKYGSDKAVVLVADLSEVQSYLDAQKAMVAWVNDIESDPEIWGNEFTVERIRQKIKKMVDRYGAGIESIFGVKAG